MREPLALFRCDASAVIGAGHVMRCLALAEMLGEAGWRVGFSVGWETIGTAPALRTSGFDVRVVNDADHDVEALQEQASGQADLLVVDHYERDARFETSCRAFVKKVLVLDDATRRNHNCDILVDAANSADCYKEHVPAGTRILAGPAYALLRRSFAGNRPCALARRDGRPVREILVSCGATDPGNVTGLVLDALNGITASVFVNVVLSSRAPHLDAVRSRLRDGSRLLLDVEDMAQLMTGADLAIGAAGLTAYERAVLGLPSILVVLADNQYGIAQLMFEAGAAIDAGAVDQNFVLRLRGMAIKLMGDHVARMSLEQAASALIDGQGARRVTEAAL